ncbi:integral membrane protein, nucleotide-sugar transporter [Rhodotorula toruloides]|uniref:Integral membrane protein, nucleotide-sugar transporter n=1 Tax=Rhodotorula toruloides TaxID=5286 RepID=A0A511KJA7_RHOTO|nr:integral membrane protein, nucleotide-sugar transporter [Rhodotorula toruloides]
MELPSSQLTSSSTGLFTKWQDMQCVTNCGALDDPATRKVFEQPVWQTATMFVGETFCLAAFSLINSRFNLFARPVKGGVSLPTDDIVAVEGKKEAKKMRFADAILFWLPAVCDILGTTFMSIGLLFIPVSVYQMLRGALVLWVGLFSVLFLHRRLTRAQWIALGVIMLGVGIVGAASLIQDKNPAAQPEAESAEKDVSPLVGVGLVLLAQVFTASQFVLEERIMEHHSVEPLLAAGYEGISGLITTLSGLFLIYRFYGSTPAGKGGYFDAPEGWHQIIEHRSVWTTSIVIAISIALFNFVSATSRSTIDSCRTLLIWVVSLALGWESFVFLQVIGFALLVYGTFVHNGILAFPHWTGLREIELPGVEADHLLDSDYDDERNTTSPGGIATPPFTPSPVQRRTAETQPLLKTAQE